MKNVFITNCYSFQSGGFFFLRPAIIQNLLKFENIHFKGTISLSRSILSTEFLNLAENNFIVLKKIVIICTDQDIINYTKKYPLVNLNEMNINQVQEGSFFLKNCNLKINSMFVDYQSVFEPILQVNSDSKIQFKRIIIHFTVLKSPFIFKIQGPSLPKLFNLYVDDLEIINLNSKNNCQNQQNFMKNLKCEALKFKELNLNDFSIILPAFYSNNCLLTYWVNKKISFVTIINFESESDESNICTFENVRISQISNSKYSSNMINILTKGQLIITMKLFSIISCDCKGSNCVRIQSQSQSQSSEINITQSKYINNYNSVNGTIYIQSISPIISESLFINNTVIEFGAALMLESQYQQRIFNTYFYLNYAGQFCGAIFSKKLDENNTQNYFLQNEADQGMPNLGILPTELSLIVFSKQKKIEFNSNSQNSSFIILQLPSGQQLEKYELFNQENLIYKKVEQSFRLIITNQFQEKQSFFEEGLNCQMKYSLLYQNLSRMTNSSLIQDLEFNDQYEINLDKVIITKNPYEKTFLKAIVACPQIMKTNHTIEFYIKTYHCQIGEILYQDQCLKCNGNQGYYSLDPLAGSCFKINTNEIKNNTENQLELYQGYWRPQVFSYQISQCHNNLLNCLGGWKAGDNTCQIGLIGALCEECDLYNIRGSGSFSSSDNFQCSNCGNFSFILIKMFILSIWIMLQINLAVKNTQMQNEKFLMLKVLTRNYIILFKNYQEQSGTLFKLIINYFQIINLFQIVSSSFDFKFGFTFQFIGNSPKSISYDLDCFLYQESSINIIYINSFYIVFISAIYLFCYLLIVKILSLLNLWIFSEETIFCSLFYLTLTTKANYINQLILLALPRQISEIEWISANVSYQYQTKIHQEFLKLYILPTLILLSVFVPSLLAIFLFQNRNSLTLYRFKRKFGYLCNDYHNQCYYWELIKLQKKEILMLFYVMFQELLTLSLLLQIFLLQLYYLALVYWKPYSLQPLNKFEKLLLSLVQLLLFFSLSQSLTLNTQTNIQLISKLCKTIILLITIYISIQKIVINFLNKYFKIIDAIKLKIFNIIKERSLVRFDYIRKIFELKQTQQNRVRSNFLKIKSALKQGLITPQLSTQSAKSPQYILSGTQDIILKTQTARSLI